MVAAVLLRMQRYIDCWAVVFCFISNQVVIIDLPMMNEIVLAIGEEEPILIENRNV